MISVIITTLGERDISGIIKTIRNQCDEIIIEVDKQSGPAKARNRAWKKAKGDVIIFLDDDIIVNDDFISQGIKSFIDYDFGQSKVIGGIENSVDKFTGTAMWFKKKTLEQVKGFDEDFSFYNEDVAMFWKCLKQKCSYIYLEKSVVWHPQPGNFERLKQANELLKKKFPDEYSKLKQEIR